MFARQRVRVLAVYFGLALLAALPGCGKPAAPPAGGETPASGGAPAASTGTKRIVILTNGPDPFWDTCEAGAKAAERDLKLKEAGFVVDFQRGDFTDKKQIDMLKQYSLAPDIVAVGISVFGPENRNLIEEMRKLQTKGVKVVTIDGDVSREKYRDARFAYLGTDNIIGGRELGRAARALSPDGANFAFFVGNVGAANAKERMAGFVEGAGAGFTEISRLDDGGDRAKARSNVEATLDQHSECNMLVGIWAYNTPQIVSVVRDREIRANQKVLCFDAAEASIREMGEGNVDVMVVQNPFQMGYDGVKLLLALVQDDKPVISAMYPNYAQEGTGDIYSTELRVVVPDNGSVTPEQASPINPEMFDPNTKFFRHSEFLDWLKERGLSSS
ncbi:MAG: substrate-binding domain-containing protein [Planctomycetaceae bacterium]|nr:substrate-binding domain-containing protein [Planctomycetaceae bacterium]